MPEIRQSITTPTNFITTTGTDVGSSIGHSTPAQVRTALGIASGFTYDQQAEPSSPTAGQTWRERTAGGLIVEEWEWSGSLWLGRRLYGFKDPLLINVATAQSFVSFINYMASNPPYKWFVQTLNYSFATDSTINASNNFTLTPNWGRHDNQITGTLTATPNSITHNNHAQYAVVSGSFDINSAPPTTDSITCGVGLQFVRNVGTIQLRLMLNAIHRRVR
jgi:hypothetical protein